MKQFIFLVGLGFIIGTGIIGCYKDEPTSATAHEQQQSYLRTEEVRIESIDPDRDGTRLPIDYPGSQVQFDYFNPGRPQIAFNIEKMDSAVYVRYSTSGAGINGVTFYKYIATKHFKDSTTYGNKVYAPASLGAIATVVPNINNSQLNIANPYNYIKLVTMPKNEPYFDQWCGKAKKRYLYTISYAQDTMGVSTIDADKCNSNVFSYKLIL